MENIISALKGFPVEQRVAIARELLKDSAYGVYTHYSVLAAADALEEMTVRQVTV